MSRIRPRVVLLYDDADAADELPLDRLLASDPGPFSYNNYDPERGYVDIRGEPAGNVAVVQAPAGRERLAESGPSLGMALDWRYVDDDRYDPDHIDCVTKVYRETDPQYAFGLIDAHYEALSWDVEGPPIPATDATLEANEINHPSWLMLFSPPMVEQYGERFLLDLPAERVERLEDGAILVVGTQQPDGDDYDKFVDPYHSSLERLEDAFGVEYRYR